MEQKIYRILQFIGIGIFVTGLVIGNFKITQFGVIWYGVYGGLYWLAYNGMELEEIAYTTKSTVKVLKEIKDAP